MRIEQLTFTRFIAAISIVIFHYGSGSYLFNNEYFSFIFQQANVGVSYFFILSGFVMIIAYGDKGNISFLNYIQNRLARIYPVYLLAIFLILSVSLFRGFDHQELLLNLFMIQSWIPQKALTINSPGWSLCVEMFFYSSFPFLMNKIYSKQKLKFNTIWIILFWLISQIIFHLIIYEIFEMPIYSTKDLFYYPLLHFNEFLIGNLTGMFFIYKLKDYQKNYLLPILVCLICLILLLRFPLGFNFHNGLLAIIFVPLILLISLSNDKISRFFSKRIFVFLGEISFSIYLLQLPVWMIFSDYIIEKYLGLNNESDFTGMFLLRLLILITISALSYLYLEKPVRSLIKTLRTTRVLRQEG